MKKPFSKPTDLSHKLDKIIQARFTASYMSDAKWVKLITCLVEHYNLFLKIEIYLVYDQKVRELIISGDEYFQHDFFYNSMENMITHPMTPGWVLYKEIELLEIFCEKIEFAQSLKTSIEKLGEFKLDLIRHT